MIRRILLSRAWSKDHSNLDSEHVLGVQQDVSQKANTSTKAETSDRDSADLKPEVLARSSMSANMGSEGRASTEQDVLQKTPDAGKGGLLVLQQKAMLGTETAAKVPAERTTPEAAQRTSGLTTVMVGEQALVKPDVSRRMQTSDDETPGARLHPSSVQTSASTGDDMFGQNGLQRLQTPASEDLEKKQADRRTSSQPVGLEVQGTPADKQDHLQKPSISTHLAGQASADMKQDNSEKPFARPEQVAVADVKQDRSPRLDQSASADVKQDSSQKAPTRPEQVSKPDAKQDSMERVQVASDDVKQDILQKAPTKVGQVAATDVKQDNSQKAPTRPHQMAAADLTVKQDSLSKAPSELDNSAADVKRDNVRKEESAADVNHETSAASLGSLPKSQASSSDRMSLESVAPVKQEAGGKQEGDSRKITATRLIKFTGCFCWYCWTIVVVVSASTRPPRQETCLF